MSELSRRDLLKAAFAAGLAGPPQAAPAGDPDYIVVGSGAGGGTVAARLVEDGYTVLVLEAGGDPVAQAGDPRDHYDVPAFHPFSTEDPALRWDFFVRHYADLAQQRRDCKFVEAQQGVWYPRAGTLGGCTAHNAMIFVAPSPSDWNYVADLTGDATWRAPAMWKYFQKVEDCRHRPLERFLHVFGLDATQHGWDGWLPTENPEPLEAILDGKVRDVIKKSIRNALRETGDPDASRLGALFDPNDLRVVERDEVGARYVPITTDRHQRTGARERLLDVCKRYPGRLRIELDALVTRVVLDDRCRAVGVEYQKGSRLYAADPRATGTSAPTVTATARREVILAGGAFNTPQLLMLSGVGDPAVLARHGIPTRVELPGVGRNLQDRYEVGVVYRMRQPWDMLRDATFTSSDRQYREWSSSRKGVYTTNGTLLSVIQRSSRERQVPDLFCYAVLADFRGYAPGYADRIRERLDVLTWVVLKGRTNNRGGRVTLASADPRQRPDINFHYFGEGTDATGADLDGVVEGVRLVRRLSRGMDHLIEAEEWPGPGRTSDADLREFVRDQAWGHHASCTCPIGRREHGGVLDSSFRVHGTEGLRVVDASIFPRIPGLFIVSAIYMAAEKAADVIAHSPARGSAS